MILRALLCLLLFTGSASAAPSIWAVSEDARVFLEQSQRTAEHPRDLTFTTEVFDHQVASSSDGVTDGQTIFLRPHIVRWARGISRPWEKVYGSEVLLHERLHTPHGVLCENQFAEEGIVQALALDRLPAWVWKRWKIRIATTGDGVEVLSQRATVLWGSWSRYTKELKSIRASSRFGSGSASWRDPAARWWRVAFREASCEQREIMLAEAHERSL